MVQKDRTFSIRCRSPSLTSFVLHPLLCGSFNSERSYWHWSVMLPPTRTGRVDCGTVGALTMEAIPVSKRARSRTRRMPMIHLLSPKSSWIATSTLRLSSRRMLPTTRGRRCFGPISVSFGLDHRIELTQLPLLANVVISIEGSLHLPNNITAVQQKVATNTNPASVRVSLNSDASSS